MAALPLAVGLLIMHDLPGAPSFAHSIQRITQLGTEPAVMGRYFPRASYSDGAGFKAPRCAKKPK